MPSFFSPSPSHGAVISSVAFAIRSFTSVSYNTFVPFWGTVLAQHGQARYPTWASTLPHLGTFAARMLPICPQYGRLRLGFLKKTEFHLSSCCFRRTKSICPSPTGEVRWGLMFIGWIDLLKSLTKQSNLFLPFGKGRMGLEARWGLIWLTVISCRVTCPFPLGRLGWVIIRGVTDTLGSSKTTRGQVKFSLF